MTQEGLALPGGGVEALRIPAGGREGKLVCENLAHAALFHVRTGLTSTLT